MELAGEILAGVFVEGISELQFAAPSFLEQPPKLDGPERIWWVNATDPASLCGLGLDLDLPKRLPGTIVVYRGNRVVVVSERLGRKLTVNIDPADPGLPECFAFFRHLFETQNKRGQLRVETINGEPASRSEFLNAIRDRFELDRGTKDVAIMGPSNI